MRLLITCIVGHPGANIPVMGEIVTKGK